MLFEVHVEKRLQCDYVHRNNWGTPDAFIFNERTQTLHIVDYKFGFRYVDEFENWQLINYAIAAAGFFKIPFDADVTVRVTIVQPRHYGRNGQVRFWEFPISKLAEYGARLRDAAHAAMGDNAPCVVGPQCTYCSGRHACEANQRAALSIAEGAFSSVPLDLPLPVMAREYLAMRRSAGILESRITGLEQQLLSACRSGANIPGVGIERAEGRQKWTKPPQEIIQLGVLLGLDLSKPSVITPKQAIRAGVSAEVVAGLSETPIGEWKLVPVDTRAARKVFGNSSPN